MVAKAVLYYDPASVWSRAALLALHEKGYGKEELDLHVVDTTKGEEFSPAMLRLNPRATVPILVVPLQGTLGVDVETRFKVIADPKALVDFLDRSRSATSRSTSTSTAPAPSLSPATVGFATISNRIIDIVYSSTVAPEQLRYYSSHDSQSLQTLGASLVPTLNTRKQVLIAHLADCEREVIKMSDKTKAFWNEKKHEIDILLQQLVGGGEHADEYFTIAKQTWEHGVLDALSKVNDEIIGPYILGANPPLDGATGCNSLCRRSDLDRGHSSLRLVGARRQPFWRQLRRLGRCSIDKGGGDGVAKGFPSSTFTEQAGGILGCYEEAAELGERFGVEAMSIKNTLIVTRVILFPTPTVCGLGDASDMASSPSLFKFSRPWRSGEQYEFLSSSDPQDVFRDTSCTVHVGELMDSSYPDTTLGDRSSSDSAASYTTPTPSRPTTPSPSFSAHRLTSSISDVDGEPASPLLARTGAYTSIRDGSRRWWSPSRRRRKRDGRIWRTFKKGVRKVVRHPWFPQQPITIIFALLLFTVFAISLTLLLMYILNPDKEPLPWQAYCAISPSSFYPPRYRTPLPYPYLNPLSESLPPAFPPDDLDAIPPAGIFLGVFSMDSALERRMLIRTTWASHPRSRNGAGPGDDGLGTSRTVVRFILGQPRKGWERRIETEMDTYNDIVVLPCPENMNAGKSHAYFTWAAENAWVPPVYVNTSTPVPRFSYSTQSSLAPHPAPHDSHFAWEDHASGQPIPWVRPDFVAKVDDDAFVILAELESRMRLELHAKGQSPYGASENATSIAAEALGSRSPVSLELGVDVIPQETDPLVYWGYLVKDLFMAGELYGLSWSLVAWISKDATIKGLTKGAEDKQTAKWMALHPQAPRIRWASERCWIYDHPRAGTVYSHGFLFPSHVTRVKRSVLSYIEKESENKSDIFSPTPPSWAHSSVSTFGVRYQQPIPDMTLAESVEALVEGSDMSELREGMALETGSAWRYREGRVKQYENKRVGGTVVVHFIKKHEWFLETALAFLEADDYSESELERISSEMNKEKLNIGFSAVWTDANAFKHINTSSLTSDQVAG